MLLGIVLGSLLSLGQFWEALGHCWGVLMGHYWVATGRATSSNRSIILYVHLGIDSPGLALPNHVRMIGPLVWAQESPDGSYVGRAGLGKGPGSNCSDNHVIMSNRQPNVHLLISLNVFPIPEALKRSCWTKRTKCSPEDLRIKSTTFSVTCPTRFK